jgi:hypothetical protein
MPTMTMTKNSTASHSPRRKPSGSSEAMNGRATRLRRRRQRRAR